MVPALPEVTSTFGERIDALKERVGTGDLVGKVTVDQVYAWNQEYGGWLNFMGRYGPKDLHPRHGGEIHFLENSLRDNGSDYLQKLADHLLEERGLYDAMVDDVEHLSAQVAIRAPVETGALRLSGHPTVSDDGAPVYDRAPIVPRLSEAELRDRTRTYRGAKPKKPGVAKRRESRGALSVKAMNAQRDTLRKRINAAGGFRYGNAAHNEALAKALGFKNLRELDREWARLEGLPQERTV